MKLFERKWPFPILLFCTLFGGTFAGSLLAFLPLSGDMQIYAGYLLSPIVLLAASAIYYGTKKIPLKAALPFSFDIKTTLLTTLAIAGFFASAVLPSYAMAAFAEKLGIAYSVTVPAPDSPLRIALSVIILAILPSLGEEIFFRKALHDTLEGLKPIQIALVSGLVFALWHMNIAQLLHQFFLGVFLSLVMQKTNSILYPILMHMINNLLAVFLSDTAFFRNFSVFGDGLVPALILFFAGIALFSVSAFFLFPKKGRIGISQGSAAKAQPHQQTILNAETTQNSSPLGKEKKEDISCKSNSEDINCKSNKEDINYNVINEDIAGNSVKTLSRTVVATLLLLTGVWIFVVIVSIMLN